MKKATVQCKCGSSFSAPASLVGQVVKCPVCGEAMRVPELPGSPETPDASQAQDAAFNEALFALSQEDPGASGTRVGEASRARSGAHAAAAKPAAGDAKGLGMCPRCGEVATDGGRLCTQCLYELHTGEHAGPRGKFKFTLGLGVSLVILVGAVTVGGYMVWNTYLGGKAVSPIRSIAARTAGAGASGSSASAAATPAGGGTKALASATGNGGASGSSAKTLASGHENGAAATRAQQVDPDAPWSALAATDRYAAIEHTHIDVAWLSTDQRRDFNIKLYPAPAAGLTMATEVVLYRGDSSQGPFEQVDRAAPSSIDSTTQALVFNVHDAEATTTQRNRVYYRLSGLDGHGGRLFDTPAAAFPLVPPMKLQGGRLTWQPLAQGKTAGDPPTVRCAFTIAAPGWRNVEIAQVIAQGPLDEPTPQNLAGLPLQATMEASMPVAIDLNNANRGQWQWQMAKQPVQGAAQTVATSAAPGAGVIPVWSDGKLAYRLTPDPSAFSQVMTQPANAPGQGRQLTFSLAGQTRRTTLDLPAVPTLARLTATPYDGKVRLTWDNADLLAERDHFTGDVAVAIYRQGAGQSTGAAQEQTLVAVAPVTQNSYTDTHVANGVTYRYEAKLVAADNVRHMPRLRAKAWMAGRGAIAILVRVQPSEALASVTPQAALDTLRVAIDASELVYPDTDLAALKVLEAVRQALLKQPGVTVIERDELRWVHETAAKASPLGTSSGGDMRPAAPFSAPFPAPSLADSLRSDVGPVLPGAPAQFSLRLSDTADYTGTHLQLWAADLVTGEQYKLAQATTGAIDVQAFVKSVLAMINRSLPQVNDPTASKSSSTPSASSPAGGSSASLRAPAHIVMGPLIRINQPQPFYDTRRMTDTLIHAVNTYEAGASILRWRVAKNTIAGGSSLFQPGSVLLAGRVWNGEKGAPTLLIHAIDPVDGRLLGRFLEPAFEHQTSPERFAKWVAGLKIPASTLDAAVVSATSPSGQPASPLLAEEAALEPVSPVWRQMASAAVNAAASAPRYSPAATLRTPVTVSVGLPLPPDLAPFSPPRRRPAGDPLVVVRPYIASPPPAMFDQWTRQYAQWIQGDYEAFRRGLLKLAVSLGSSRGGMMTPRLIIRGRMTFTGPIQGPMSLAFDPRSLNVRTFCPVGGSSPQGIIDYRASLADMFTRRPWAAYHAWQQVPRGLAEPFLKAELLGVQSGQFGSVNNITMTQPPSFDRYLAAILLGRLGNPVGVRFREQAMRAASNALQTGLNGQGAAGASSQQITNALLILLYEKNPSVMDILQRPGVLQRYLTAGQTNSADMLRFLVDRLGATAWRWAAAQPTMNWADFLWRSEDERQSVAKAIPQVAAQYPTSSSSSDSTLPVMTRGR